MSKKKKTRTAGSGSGAPKVKHRRSWRKRLLNGPTLIFISLIVLMAAAAAVAALMQGDDGVECPPGLVWSDDHAHCH